MSLDKQVRDLFAQHNVPLAPDDTWKVQQATVIRHKALERLGAAAGVQWSYPTVVRAAEDEAVLIVSGEIEGRMEWSVGEAKLGANYRVSGKQASYLWSMAEKRGKDRVILKLVGLHGLYSEEEADEFKDGAQPSREEPQDSPPAPPPPPASATRKTISPKDQYLRSTGDKIRAYPGTEAELRHWWAAEAETRRYYGLTQTEVAALVALIANRIAKMKEAA